MDAYGQPEETAMASQSRTTTNHEEIRRWVELHEG
jgi:hypothetical protein